ncbi:MAG: carboxylesterase family protein, partial [Burkholderiaceae bacterium]
MNRAFPVRGACTLLAALALAACGGNDPPAPGASPAPGSNAPTPPPTLRLTTLGAVSGTDDTAASGTYSWKGIPFAKPPVGALRWRAPADPEPWTGTRAAQQFGNACASSGRTYGPGRNNRYDATIGTSFNSTVGSEDCLYLNIWRPATSTGKLP